MKTAAEYINEHGYNDGDQFSVEAVSRIINEARTQLLNEIKEKVVENRNLAHVNCLEESKQAFNQVINIIDNTKRDKIK